jgi:hypothetical protein
MRGAVEDHLVAAGAEVEPEADRVAHRARRQEERRLFSEQGRHPLLKVVHGGIVEALLVAHLGARDRLAHRGGRPGLGVAVEVDRRHVYLRRRESSASVTTR